MMKKLVAILLLACAAAGAWAQANLTINTPAIEQLRSSMRARHSQMRPFMDAGAIGLANDATIQVRDASLIPLPQRGLVNNLLTQENADRAALYREIARANGHPEWEGEIRSTFAARFAEHAHAGWWYQDANGTWLKK
jgi:uncharacterized protein YdbL (DUF1318 family)